MVNYIKQPNNDCLIWLHSIADLEFQEINIENSPELLGT